MDYSQIKKLLEDLACSPYIESKVSHTLSHKDKRMLEISYKGENKTYEIVKIENQCVEHYVDVNSAALAITTVINHELQTEYMNPIH
ncbi:hypothetical protein [Peribacillus deserti]|uniref:Uncharacterized protein n=1 Tax=Peribacillus deserti TaxID=673318 RepID=A0A2N5M6K9_9BACI|nr:hypothetical protein [Peribacillus deserti]PLT30004.1 hypothetical protein CUU66_10030 [Peribacillus deserti]